MEGGSSRRTLVRQFPSDRLPRRSRNAYLTSHGRVADAIAELKAFVIYDLQKLVTYGVATSVDAEVKYIGNNTVTVAITIYGQRGEITRVGLNASRLRNSWAWET